MTVSPVSTAVGPPTITVVTSSLASLRENVLSAVAGTVNTSVADLQGRLRSGQSLADVARAAGVPRPELLETVREAMSVTGGLVADLPQDKVVQRIADHRQKVPRSPQTGPGNGGAGDGPAREAGDETLGARVDLRL